MEMALMVIPHRVRRNLAQCIAAHTGTNFKTILSARVECGCVRVVCVCVFLTGLVINHSLSIGFSA